MSEPTLGAARADIHHYVSLTIRGADPEVWRPVVGYEGKYEVSTTGRVRSLDPRHGPAGLILTPKIEKRYGYPYVDLWRSSKARRRYVHVLMLLAFKGQRPAGMDGRHLDDVKTHNVITNLEWGTRTQNMRDAAANGRSGSRWGKALSTAQQEAMLREWIGSGKGTANAKRVGAAYGVGWAAVYKAHERLIRRGAESALLA